MLDGTSDISEYLQQYSSYFDVFNVHSGKNPNSKVPEGKKIPLVTRSVMPLFLNYHHILNTNSQA